MPYLKKATILFDLAHNEMLNPEDDEFSEFFNLLERLSIRIRKNEDSIISEKLLEKVNLLILGNPLGDFFSRVEINAIVDYVREGGSCLILSEYGSDLLQKTNLNDLTKNFGIFFEKDIVKETNKINQNCNSILSIPKYDNHVITNQIREIIIGGSCSLAINKDIAPLLVTSNTSWTEIFNEKTLNVTKEEKIPSYILAACTEYGKGKLFALGDIDLFTNEFINQRDNRKFILNLLEWLSEPVQDSDVLNFILTQMSSFQNEMKEMTGKIDNIIETVTLLEERISSLEVVSQEKLKGKNFKREIEDEAIEEKSTLI